MGRAKTILVLVIPALLLVAALGYVADPVCSFGTEGSAVTFSADRQGKQDSSTLPCSFEQIAGLAGRRLNLQSGLELFSVLPSSCPVKAPAHLTHSSSSCLPASGLAKDWQFRWRTALEPRAPTSIL